MKSIRKLKKYGTAVAGSALLIGATLTGASASNHDLGDYPQPFVDEDGEVQASIVVGEDAATADVVGAIDIAGSLGQEAFTTESVDSGVSVDGEEAETTLRQKVGSGNLMVDKSDYSVLARKNVEDSDGDNHFVTESAGLDEDGGSAVKTKVNGSEVLTVVPEASVDYEVSYAPGFEAGEEVSLLGESYELVSVSGPEADLGTTIEADPSIGESFEHGAYTVNVEGGNSENGEVLVNVMEDGDQVDSGQLSGGETLDVNDDFSVTADTVFYSSDEESWVIQMESVLSEVQLEEGEAFPLDEDYRVEKIDSKNGDTLEGLELTNKLKTVDDPDGEEEREHLKEGETFSGPQDYFHVGFEGLTQEATTEIEVEDEYDVTYTDKAGFEHTLDISKVTEASGAVEATADNPWTSTSDPVAFYDDPSAGTSGAWDGDSEGANDVIVEDFHNGGTLSLSPDTLVSSGDDSTVDMTDGASATNNDFDETTYKIVDDGNDGFQAGTDDDIVTDNGGTGTFSASADTNLAGTAPSDGATLTSTNQWADADQVAFYDGGTSGTWESGNDIIVQDFHSGGTVSVDADATVNAEGNGVEASDGAAIVDLSTASGGKWINTDGSGDYSTEDEIVSDDDEDGFYTSTGDYIVDEDGSVSADIGDDQQVSNSNTLTDFVSSDNIGLMDTDGDGSYTDTNENGGVDIFIDSDGDNTYQSGEPVIYDPDTSLTGGTNQDTGAESVTDLFYYDSGGTSGAYDDGEDIIRDDGGSGTYSDSADTPLNTGNDASIGASNGATLNSLSDITGSTYYLVSGDSTVNDGESVIRDSDSDGVYTVQADNYLAGITLSNAGAGTSLTDTNQWTGTGGVRFVDQATTGVWESSNDIIVTDDDEDGVYTSQGDTVVNDEGTANRDPGDALVSLGNSARFYNADGSGSYTTGDEVYLDDDSDNVYTAQQDNVLAGDSLGEFSNNVDLSTTNPWKDAAKQVFFYDSSSGGNWDSANDLIALDTNEDGKYQLDDEKLAGIEPSSSSSTGLFEEGSGDKEVYTDVNGRPLKVEFDDSKDEVDLTYENFEKTGLDSGDDGTSFTTGYGFSFTFSFTDSDGDSTKEVGISGSDAVLDTRYSGALVYSSVSGDVIVDQDSSISSDKNLEVVYSGTDITDVRERENPVVDISSEDTEDITNYGTVVAMDSDKSPVTIEIPEEQRKALHTVGGEASSGEGTVSTPAGWPEAGSLDSEASEGHRILVGGPAINELTAELAEEGSTRAQENYNEGTGYLELVDQAFDGDSALVVAGHSADDTRNAAEFLANYGDHSDALSGQDQVTISTETGNVVE